MSEQPLPNNDQYYMGIAFAVRERANCTGNRVGAVVVRGNRVISTGYNGVPDGMPNCLEGGCLRCSNPGGQFPSGHGYDLCICVHAEQNALLAAARFGIAVEGGTLYTTMQPCFGCLKESLQAHIERIVYLHPWIPTDADAAMQMRKVDEYAKLAAQVRMERIEMKDPRETWAVRALRIKA